MVFSKVDILPDLVMSGAFGHIDSLMVDWTDSLNDGMQPRSQVRMVIDMVVNIATLKCKHERSHMTHYSQ